MTDSELLPFLDRLADAASESIMPHFRALDSVENKASSGFDPVTIADRAAEAAIRRLIVERFPEHGIMGEEYGSERLEAEKVWVLDPIDGTRAFISGLPVWGTLIGLLSGGTPSIGMMAQPFTGERYSGDGSSARRSTSRTRPPSAAWQSQGAPASARACFFCAADIDPVSSATRVAVSAPPS